MLKPELREALRAVRDEAAANGVDAAISLHRENSHLIRIGNNSVSLNTSESLSRLDVEVTDGRRQGSHTHMGEIDSTDTVRRVVETATKKAAVAAPKDYTPISAVVEETVQEDDQHDPQLADLDPKVKADTYSRIIDKVGDAYNYSGSWSSGVCELYVISTANTNEAWHSGTDQKFSVVLKHPEHKWELSHDQTGWRSGAVTAESAIAALQGLLPTYEQNDGFEVEPGEYTVLFGPQAIAEIFAIAGWTGFFGRSWEEKMGWTAHNKPGDSVLGENVTVVDDPGNDNTFRFGFDYQGKRRRPFPLVEGGKLRQLMYDASTAGKYGKEPTGHDIYSPSIVVAPGSNEHSALEAVSGMGRVLSIPALHYMHVPNRSEGVFTGSSRFSAVLVEDGQIARPIFSTRITDTFQRVLGQITEMSSEAVSVNLSNTYGRRSPDAMSVPAYVVAEGVKITDCADSF